ncbi:hypothetical protein NE237_013929 [Protea cynaroides]|uniref:Uncharacterized protein n=1 Tax=Protea cynaroides TaxID=273540 RepID=A0A9Q0H1X8_9MAGN|nr:hypothetical protein NE237_013929 [Protea cynaroides]
MSKVIGRLMRLSTTVLYDRHWKTLPMRKLMGTVRIVYATSLLLDLVLVSQINLKMEIPNETYVQCMSGSAETIAQFKLLPFSVLSANLCPPGYEGSLTLFLASALCIIHYQWVYGCCVESVMGISYGDSSTLPMGILLQFLARLLKVYPVYQNLRVRNQQLDWTAST